ncbi:MAG: RNA polymerase factor sigma-54 [Clostridiales bacterium]|nr:RNA polymerase factor sigma-54 [Clostridiales bacterium]
MDLSQNITVENKQILSQAQIQSLEILAMDAVELEEFLQNEYMSNPLLEHRTDSDMHISMENDVRWFENSRSYKGRDYRGDSDDDFDAYRNLAAADPEYLKNYFVSQLDHSRFSKEEWSLALYMIDCLDDDGYFRMTVEEVTKLTDASTEQVQKVLDVLRDLEPFGVFSPNLAECLIKQLEVQGLDEPNLCRIIREYLPEISEGKISVISRNTGLTTSQIRKYIAIIAKLQPKPLSGLQETEVSYIVPDIIYTRKDNGWEIAINDRWMGEYHINTPYLQMMKDAKDPELTEYFKTKLERSRFILRSIAQRRETMNSIAQAILEKQEDYFLGKGLLRPMTMSSLAEEMDVHPSTVSRAVKGKYIKAPIGTILIKNLFQSGISTDKGEDMSAERIKEHIKMLIEQEDKRKPYSDAKLVELLVAEGIHISRRAVAKYRDELFIRSSFDRKIR